MSAPVARTTQYAAAHLLGRRHGSASAGLSLLNFELIRSNERQLKQVNTTIETRQRDLDRKLEDLKRREKSITTQARHDQFMADMKQLQIDSEALDRNRKIATTGVTAGAVPARPAFTAAAEPHTLAPPSPEPLALNLVGGCATWAQDGTRCRADGCRPPAPRIRLR